MEPERDCPFQPALCQAMQGGAGAGVGSRVSSLGWALVGSSAQDSRSHIFLPLLLLWRCRHSWHPPGTDLQREAGGITLGWHPAVTTTYCQGTCCATFLLVPGLPLGFAFHIQHAWALCQRKGKGLSTLQLGTRFAWCQQATGGAVRCAGAGTGPGVAPIPMLTSPTVACL